MSESRRGRTGRFTVFAANDDVVAAIGRLRGRERTSFDAAQSDLEAQGCRQAGYRLLDADGTPAYTSS